MPVPKKIMDKIKNDFWSSPDNELLDLKDSELVKFLEWFESNANKFEISNNPNKKLINKSNIPGRCFGNSQIISINNPQEYSEGFIKVKGTYNLHGFNIKDNTVEDYTVLSNPEVFKDDNGNLPTEYYGILIPKDFITKHNNHLIKINSMNIPQLIDKYYKPLEIS